MSSWKSVKIYFSVKIHINKQKREENLSPCACPQLNITFSTEKNKKTYFRHQKQQLFDTLFHNLFSHTKIHYNYCTYKVKLDQSVRFAPCSSKKDNDYFYITMSSEDYEDGTEQVWWKREPRQHCFVSQSGPLFPSFKTMTKWGCFTTK